MRNSTINQNSAPGLLQCITGTNANIVTLVETYLLSDGNVIHVHPNNDYLLNPIEKLMKKIGYEVPTKVDKLMRKIGYDQ